MNSYPAATACITRDCSETAHICEITFGRLWTFTANYCNACYQRALAGEHLPFERTRLQVRPSGEEVVAPAIDDSA